MDKFEKEKSSSKNMNEITTFPIPIPYREITNNIPTAQINNLSKKEIINKAYTFHSQGNIPEAASYYRYFLEKGFKDPYVFSNYGSLLRDLGKSDEAELLTRKAIDLKPDFAEAYYNLGMILENQRKFKEAETALRTAIKLNPILTEAYLHLGNILREVGKLEDAELFIRKAIDINPTNSIPYVNLGSILWDLGKSKEAITLIRKSILLNPKYAIAYSNLGYILQEIGNQREAEIVIRKAIKLNPNFAYSYLILGIILKNNGKNKEAEIANLNAIKLDPNLSEAYSNLGEISYEKGNLDQAENYTRKAIKLDPKLAQAQWNLSHILLKQFKFDEGWSKYEWRWKASHKKGYIGKKLHTSKPEWQPNSKGRVFLWSEQAVGDQMLFSSLIYDFINEVDQLIVRVDKRLITLFKRSFKDKVTFIDENYFLEEDKYDFQIAMGSLPKYLRPTLESFKKSKNLNFLVNKEKSDKFRTTIMSNKYKKIVGISWKSTSKINKNRSLSLEEFILGIYRPEICFVCLQYGEVKEEITNIKNNYGINICEFEEIDKFENIDELTALASICDEIVSIENMTLFIAGGLGIKSYILLTPNCLWYSGHKELKSDWYPSLNFVRQGNETNWNKVLKEIKDLIKT